MHYSDLFVIILFIALLNQSMNINTPHYVDGRINNLGINNLLNFFKFNQIGMQQQQPYIPPVRYLGSEVQSIVPRFPVQQQQQPIARGTMQRPTSSDANSTITRFKKIGPSKIYYYFIKVI